MNLPMPKHDNAELSSPVARIVRFIRREVHIHETAASFVMPLGWRNGSDEMLRIGSHIRDLEKCIDTDVFNLYGLSLRDRAFMESGLAPLTHGGLHQSEDEQLVDIVDEADDGENGIAVATREEVAIHWISYALGAILGRFQPGVPGAPGRGIYRRSDFAVGSLPEPDEAEFNELVGPPEHFSCVDAEGGRHVFSVEVEQALRDLAVPDGITVLDEGRPRDLPALVDKALTLMWGEAGSRQIIAAGAGGDLRKLLERDYFTKWHLKWYRKRPVYWPLQSAKRGYGFVIFHEKIGKDTLYVLQREYLDHKLKGLRLEMEDLRKRLDGLSGRARKQVEKDLDRTTQLLNEVTEFAAAIERIAEGGYRPEPNWIDDGVILRLAPLWELIPFWRAESKRSWERLQRGDYDWSHIAMNYWPDRVKEKCQTDKSLAIAHGV